MIQNMDLNSNKNINNKDNGDESGQMDKQSRKTFTIKGNLGRKAIYKIWIYIHYLYGYFTETPLFLSRIHYLFLLKLVRFCVTYAMNQSSVLLWAALSHSEINTNKTKTLATESICTKIDDYQNEPIKLLYVGCLTHLESILHTVLSKHENTLLIQVMFPKTIQRNTQKGKTGCFNSRLWNSILLILHLTNILHYQTQQTKRIKIKMYIKMYISQFHFFMDKAKKQKRKKSAHSLSPHKIKKVFNQFKWHGNWGLFPSVHLFTAYLCSI